MEYEHLALAATLVFTSIILIQGAPRTRSTYPGAGEKEMDEFLSGFGANLNGKGVKEAFAKAFEFYPEYMVEDGYEEVEKHCKSVVEMDKGKDEGKSKGKGKGKDRGYPMLEMGVSTATTTFPGQSFLMGNKGPKNQFGGTSFPYESGVLWGSIQSGQLGGISIPGMTGVPVKEDIHPTIKVACYHLTAKAEMEDSALIGTIHRFLYWFREKLESAYDNPHVAFANLPGEFQTILTKWSTVVAVCRDARKRQDMDESGLILGCMAMKIAAAKDDAAMGKQQSEKRNRAERSDY